jgi:hypothetical protein
MPPENITITASSKGTFSPRNHTLLFQATCWLYARITIMHCGSLICCEERYMVPCHSACTSPGQPLTGRRHAMMGYIVPCSQLCNQKSGSWRTAASKQPSLGLPEQSRYQKMLTSCMSCPCSTPTHYIIVPRPYLHGFYHYSSPFCKLKCIPSRGLKLKY